MAKRRDSFDFDADDPLTAVEVSLGMVQIHSLGKNEDMYKLENVDHRQTQREEIPIDGETNSSNNEIEEEKNIWRKFLRSEQW